MVVKFALALYCNKFSDFCVFCRIFGLAPYKSNYSSFLAIIFAFLAEICIGDGLGLVIGLGVRTYVSSISGGTLTGVFKS